MKKRSFLRLSLIGGVCLFSFATLLATTLFKPIRASINNNYTYTLNGKTIMKGQPTILYKGKFYAPIDSMATALGYNVSIQESQSLITSPSKTPSDTTTLDNATITAIDFATNRITVYPTNKPNTPENQIDLFITPKTVITDAKTKQIYSITDLNTGMNIQATYSSKTTKSSPPQANATEIKILNKQSMIQPREEQ